MNTLILNGSPRRDGDIAALVQQNFSFENVYEKMTGICPSLNRIVFKMHNNIIHKLLTHHQIHKYF